MNEADAFWLPGPQMSPEEWLVQHQQVRLHFWGPRDTRISAGIPGLAREICALRCSLEQLRLAFEKHPDALRAFRERLGSERVGMDGIDAGGRLVVLIDSCLSRIDWREQDILEMILEYLENGATSRPDHDERAKEATALAGELSELKKLRDQDRPAYERAVQGLISEARGSLMGLKQACGLLRNHSLPLDALNEEAIRLLIQSLARTMGIAPNALPPGPLPEDPAWLWEELCGAAQEKWRKMSVVLPLKPFEKASLFLLEALPLAIEGHAGFVRYLIENEDAYRRLLAICYAPLPVQKKSLGEELERYNRLPEYAARPLRYDDPQQQFFLYAFLLRPDVVAAIVERERQKDIYRVISGLSSKAHLPRVLHEVQNIFGYVTPEAFEKIVATLNLEPVDVIRVIASYKQYSADPGGDILIYICKGTACFLRGQPELSRRLALEIEAEEGEVGRHGIQFIEMDCFGVCHLAPVVKARDVFLGKRTGEDIPRLLEQLLKGTSYENRMMFLNRIRQMLAPGHESEPLQGVCVLKVEEDGTPPMSHQGETPEQQQSGLEGCAIQLSASGHIFALSGAQKQDLGRLLPDSLAFTIQAPDGTERVGAVIMDETSQIIRLAQFHAPFLEQEMRCTLKPRATVADGAVWVERTGGRLRLGAYTANVIAVETEGMGCRLLHLSGAASQIPPEKEEGLATRQLQTEDEAFLSRQDRLVLGFTAQADPQEIESYLAQGGYAAVKRVLGLSGEPAWAAREIIAEVARARLRGRGGAGFPTGRKWEAVYLAKSIVEESDENQSAMKLIVANGDEGDPGAFMDRTLIQERPHQVIEGMILAALAVAARYGVIYVRKEYEDAVRRLEHALFQARRKGLLGENIFSTAGLHFDIEIRLGAGAFVAGEKRAIMRAIEGEPAEPTLNAVSNTYRGLWGKPTLLNNVETFANAPLIIQRGGNWYARQGTEQSGGSKIFSVAGIVKQTGLVEVRFGRTLDDIVRICGGIQDGKRLAGVQIGGPSGAILSLTGVRSYLMYTPLDFDSFDQVGAMLGSGGLVFIGEDDDVVRLARHFTDWLAEESCGQCPPCMQGTVSLGKTLDVILQGEGASDHLHALWAKSDAIKAGSQCGLGTTSANPVTSALRFFPHAFLHYLLGNPRLNRLELFRVLEGLRLLTRGNVERIATRRRQVVGYSFVLKKHLLRHLVNELERLDQYRPSPQRRTGHFLALLQVRPHEVGTRDVGIECTLEELEQHRQYLQDVYGEPTHSRFANAV